MEKYNGWTNYATWRVNLELFDGGDYEGYDANAMRELAEELIITDAPEGGMAVSYAMAFLSDVNWHEIAEWHKNEEESEQVQS